MARIFISHSSGDNEAALRPFGWLGEQGFAQARALGKAIFPVIDAPSGGERLVGNDLQVTDLLADREGGLERLSRSITQIALQSPDGFDLP
jgi:hypothetical protein